MKNVGICIRDSEGTVLHQNKTCNTLCGDQRGKKCTQGCIAIYNSRVKSKDLHHSHLVRNQMIKNIHCDLVFLKDKMSTATFILISDNEHRDNIAGLQSLGLTRREIEIYDLVMSGMTNAEIADSIFISKSTLKTHINNIYKKISDSPKHKQLKRF